GDDEIIGPLRLAVFVLDDLRSVRQRVGRVVNFDVVVMLLVNRRPVGKAGGDGTGLVAEGDGNRLLRAVAAGLQAEVFIPVRVGRIGGQRLAEIAKTVAVHGAMQI